MKEYSIEEVMGTARPSLGDDVPLLLFRILRIVGMRSLLGARVPDRPSTSWEIGRQHDGSEDDGRF